MQNIKRILAGMLSLVLVLTLCAQLVPVIPAAAAKGLTLDQLMEKFPDGKYWNGGNPDGWTNTPCTHHGYCGGYDGRCGCNSFMGMSIQCMGFAEKLGYDATGYNPRVNANGWYTYTSSSALNNLKPGDIVRRNGHSMYVIGVDGQTVTFADCNSRNRSCNIRWGGVTTKSSLRNNFEHVRSAPFPLVSGYLGSCSIYVSSGSVILDTATVLMSYPCTTQTYEESVPVATIPAGTALDVTNVYENSVGEYWYQIQWNGENCYFPAGNAGSFEANVGSITATDITAPINTRQGSSFSIKGEVTSQVLPLSQVTAHIFEGTSLDETPYMTSSAEEIDSFAYTIAGNAVDNGLTFGRLPAGEYTYLLTASVTNHFVGGDQLFEDQHITRLHQNTFTVSEKVSCSHSFTAEELIPVTCGDDGMTAYTCSKCGFYYTQTYFATGEHSYETEVFHEATCTEPGSIMVWCQNCVLAYSTLVPALGHSYKSEFAWSEDHRSCEATLTCTRECGTQVEQSCTVTTDRSGQLRHTAVVQVDGQEFSDTITCDNDIITFRDWDGRVLSVDCYCRGQQVVVPADPARNADETYSYTFAGWDRDVTVCNGSAIYTATYTATYVDYTITFQYEDGTVIWEDTFHYGDTVTPPETPAVPDSNYIFTGWEPEIIPCQGNATYTAVFVEPAETGAGDLTADGVVDNQDVAYLLWYTLFPEDYPITADADFNGDGIVSNEDVAYLLWHTLFPDDYPLS